MWNNIERLLSVPLAVRAFRGTLVSTTHTRNKQQRWKWKWKQQHDNRNNNWSITSNEISGRNSNNKRYNIEEYAARHFVILQMEPTLPAHDEESSLARRKHKFNSAYSRSMNGHISAKAKQLENPFKGVHLSKKVNVRSISFILFFNRNRHTASA